MADSEDDRGTVYQGGRYTGAAPPPPTPPQPGLTVGQKFVNQFVTPPRPATIAVQASRPKVVVRQRSNHTGLHLVLTLCTFGLWLPVWMLIAFGGSMWNALMRLLRR